MANESKWKNNEANFGKPEDHQISGGMRITFEVIPRFKERYVAVRRPNGIPNHSKPGGDEPEGGFLYFCHGLIRYGEPLEACVPRLVSDQMGLTVTKYQVVDIESVIKPEENQWAFIPVCLADVDRLPEISDEISEIVTFTSSDVPDGLAWWGKDELKDFLSSLWGMFDFGI